MNVKPIQVVLALVALAALALLFNWSLHHWTRHDLALEMAAEPPLAIHEGETLEGKLRSMPKDTRLTLDGQAEPLAVDGKDELHVPLEAAGPGLHVAQLDVGSRSTTKDGVRLWDRSIDLGVMKGPFEPADKWYPCAVELHVRQSLLDSFLGPEMGRQLSSLKGLSSAPAGRMRRRPSSGPATASTARFTSVSRPAPTSTSAATFASRSTPTTSSSSGAWKTSRSRAARWRPGTASSRPRSR